MKTQKGFMQTQGQSKPRKCFFCWLGKRYSTVVNYGKFQKRGRHMSCDKHRGRNLPK